MLPSSSSFESGDDADKRPRDGVIDGEVNGPMQQGEESDGGSGEKENTNQQTNNSNSNSNNGGSSSSTSTSARLREALERIAEEQSTNIQLTATVTSLTQQVAALEAENAGLLAALEAVKIPSSLAYSAFAASASSVPLASTMSSAVAATPQATPHANSASGALIQDSANSTVKKRKTNPTNPTATTAAELSDETFVYPNTLNYPCPPLPYHRDGTPNTHFHRSWMDIVKYQRPHIPLEAAQNRILSFKTMHALPEVILRSQWQLDEAPPGKRVRASFAIPEHLHLDFLRFLDEGVGGAPAATVTERQTRATANINPSEENNTLSSSSLSNTNNNTHNPSDLHTPVSDPTSQQQQQQQQQQLEQQFALPNILRTLKGDIEDHVVKEGKGGGRLVFCAYCKKLISSTFKKKWERHVLTCASTPETAFEGAAGSGGGGVGGTPASGGAAAAVAGMHDSTESLAEVSTSASNDGLDGDDNEPMVVDQVTSISQEPVATTQQQQQHQHQQQADNVEDGMSWTPHVSKPEALPLNLPTATSTTVG